MEEKQVVIIGAGCAGMSAAYQLHKANVPFVVIEANDFVGGRVCYLENDDIQYTNGPTFTEPQWGTTFEYIGELGYDELCYEPLEKIYGMYLNGEVRIFEDNGNLFESLMQLKGVPKKLLAQGLRMLPALAKDMASLGDNHDFSKLVDVSRLSTREYSEKHGGPEVADKLFGPMLGMMVLARSGDVSAAHPIALLRSMKGMVAVVGGLKIINEGIYEKIGSDKVRLNTRVEEVVIEDNEIKGVKLEGGEFIDTDKVIMATDAYDALNLMPNLPPVMSDALKTCDYSRTWHYVVYAPGKYLPDGFLGLWIPESENSILTQLGGVTCTELDHIPGTEPKHDFSGGATIIHTFTSFHFDDELLPMTDEERDARVIDELDKFLPGLKAAGPEVIGHDRIERAINLEAPGQFEAINDLKDNHLSDVKGLYLGGEYMFLIACTEGAWATGKEAALKLISEL